MQGTQLVAQRLSTTMWPRNLLEVSGMGAVADGELRARVVADVARDGRLGRSRVARCARG